MRRPVVRFALACLLFAGWMGYLIYLAMSAARPIVLSRPQLLVSELDVIAEVTALDEPALVQKVAWVREGIKAPAEGKKITIDNLRECKRLPREGENLADVPRDWTGPGLYLLPLKRLAREGDLYSVVEIPPSPGFPPSRQGVAQSTPRIYPDSKETRRQLEQIKPQ